MPSIEEQVAALRGQIAEAQAAGARAQHRLEQAEAREGAAAEALQSEFGVAPGEEAEKLLAGLEEQLAAELAKVRAELAGAGGNG